MNRIGKGVKMEVAALFPVEVYRCTLIWGFHISFKNENELCDENICLTEVVGDGVGGERDRESRATATVYL